MRLFTEFVTPLDMSLMITVCAAYYKAHPSGGPLHVALDDGNMEDTSIEFCIDAAHEEKDTAGVILGVLLLVMKESERERLYEDHYDGYAR